MKAELASCGLSRKEWYGSIYLNSIHWKELRQSALNHYGRKCNRCISTVTLQVHHLKYRHIYDVKIGDLEILCTPCHKTEHGISKPKKPRKKKVPKQKKSKPHKPTPSQVRATFDLESEIEKWSHSFRRHPMPEVSAIKHLLRTKGWYMTKQTRDGLKFRRRTIENLEHPMVAESHALESAFIGFTG